MSFLSSTLTHKLKIFGITFLFISLAYPLSEEEKSALLDLQKQWGSDMHWESSVDLACSTWSGLFCNTKGSLTKMYGKSLSNF